MSNASKFPRVIDRLNFAIDGRTRLGRAIKRATAAMLHDVGGNEISTAEMATIQRAAELLVLAGEARARLLRMESDDLSAVVRIENAAQRALQRLGDVRTQRRSPSLHERLASLSLPLEP
jgi:hypothetical protein